MISHRQLFLQHLGQTSDFPLLLEVEKAEGVYLIDPAGKKYIDLISGIGVSNVGHRHPAVVEAIKFQADRYLHVMVYGEYVQAPQTQLAEALAITLPPSLNQVFLVNSGSEAVEGALKLAKRYTGRPNLISCVDAYHGSSQGALAMCGHKEFSRATRPLVPGVRHMHFNQLEDLTLIDTNTAAVIIEPIQAEAGIRLPDPGYLIALRQRCNETNTLLIFDEIQTGFGRTGSFWAFEQEDVVPDILVCAKGMGGGLPLGAFIASENIMGVLKNNPILGHITTFGGHPLSAAASLATLKVILKEGLIDQVKEKGHFIASTLRHPSIKEIRYRGLMMAVEFADFDTLKAIIDTAIAKGLVTDWFLFCNKSMRIAPPLTISMEEIATACEIILQAVEQVSGLKRA